MTDEQRKEDLYESLFEIMQELTEFETPDAIFDRVVEDFAYRAEYHMGQADTFKTMLDTFRHDLPEDYVPGVSEEEAGEALDEILDSVTPPTQEELFGGVNDINRQYMLEDRDTLMEFLKSAHFPDRLES